ncbi:cobaltochelatase subunit CobN [Carboxylicivirga sp. A043]|uniref:cobaltochelatase subunit CobN n=1 Tax=Carboxylicivirga litoralis TaxID=2816963 RepID=UPI0021CB7630|nr:cobaltochelatase subunit CobN [Carboxylicivirga sp. A043]MCU4155533.1 cobaltochelatase subunit CobN [Carboxylicivirga sp. A043]
MNKKYLIALLLAIVVIGISYTAWSKWLAPTKVALINYPEFMATKIARSVDNYFIDVDIYEDENEVKKLEQYDMMLIFGMGLKLTTEQEAYIKRVGEKGTGIYLQSSTTKGLELTNLEDSVKTTVKDYLDNGGNKNYANVLCYIRTEVAQKPYFVQMPDAPLEVSSDVLFHIDEDVAYEKVADFETYAQENGFHKEGQKKVIFFTSIPGPFIANRDHLNSLIEEMQGRGVNLYPVSGFRGRLNYLKEIKPDLIIYMPHGRLSMGGSAKKIAVWLKQQNVPVLCPITVHQREDDWLKDRQGMVGGLLSQSVTMPEFDGGIVPYACIAQEEDDKGFLIFKAIPNRMKKFGQMVSNYLKLQVMSNEDKKLAIVYFKGPGKNALTAANMEVLPSLHNMLLHLKKEGYDLGNLPSDYPSFENEIMTKGPVLGPYAEGAFDKYLATGEPELIAVDDYNQWAAKVLPEELMQDVVERYGKAPGSYMDVYQDGKEYIAVARVKFGNVVLLPQQMPGLGDNTFELVHGAKVAPPHTYIAPYLWIQKGFKADAVMHFGTHGSLEFTPGKQIALSDYDWTDPLIGTAPHSYVYTISNVGEGMIAKRRSYASTQTYLTPPFIKANAMQKMQILSNKLNQYTQAKGALKTEYALSVKDIIVEKGMHKELDLDSLPGQAYTEEEMIRIQNFVEELSHEKITGGLYTMGVPYSAEKLDETILMMHNDELAYHLAEVDVLAGRVTREQLRDRQWVRSNYITPSEAYVKQVLKTGQTNAMYKQLIAKADLKRAMAWQKLQNEANTKASAHGGGHPHGVKKEASHPHGVKKDGKKAEKPKVDGNSGASQKKEVGDPKEKAFAMAVFNVEATLKSILSKKDELANSSQMEFAGIVNALNGRFTSPTPGGDPVANPETVPTGRNLFSVNTESTPTKEAWNVAKKLGDDLLADYRKKHGAYPQKVSFTLWSSAFIESEGTTIAQILYLLGVEPVWTPRGKVNDIRLMDEEELGRPRIDVVIQTSGQLRDLAASRLAVINRAISMAAEAGKENNFVSKGIADAEKHLIEKGFSPKQARAFAAQRVFGGVNGNYGASIMGMVEASDRWDSTSTVAQTYINNMGAFYGNEKEWGEFNEGVFEAALLNTEAVVQPRQSNTWGALSLDHVYEFMGGLNLAIHEVTGNDAESYFNDFRNASNPRIQGLKEAIGVESRTTLLNERYIKEHMKGGASSADGFAETFRNTFGWNVMKPSVVEERLWNDLYDVYVEDKLNLGVHDFFERENPYALQEMTAVMLETVRKGMWKASAEQIKAMSELHAGLVEQHEAGCSGFVCDNAKLRSFISEQLPAEQQQAYSKEIDTVRESKKEASEENMVLKKDEKINPQEQTDLTMNFDLKTVGGIALLVIILIIFFIRRRRK